MTVFVTVGEVLKCLVLLGLQFWGFESGCIFGDVHDCAEYIAEKS